MRAQKDISILDENFSIVERALRETDLAYYDAVLSYAVLDEKSGKSRVEVAAEQYGTDLDKLSFLNSRELYIYRDWLTAVTLRNMAKATEEKNIPMLEEGIATLKKSFLINRRKLVFAHSKAYKALLLDNIYRDSDGDTQEYFLFCVTTLAQRNKIDEVEYAENAVKQRTIFSLRTDRLYIPPFLVYLVTLLAACFVGWVFTPTLGFLSVIPLKLAISAYVMHKLHHERPLPRLAIEHVPKNAKTVVLSDDESTLENCKLTSGGDNIIFYKKTTLLPRGIKYAIVLPKGAELLPGGIVQLVATMLHPANTPKIISGSVKSGHALVQPRCYTDPSVASKSYFAELFLGIRGISAGGIYDIPACRMLVRKRLPLTPRLRAYESPDIKLFCDFPKNAVSAGEIFRNRIVSSLKDSRALFGFIPQDARFTLLDRLMETLLPAVTMISMLYGFYVGGYLCIPALACALLPWIFEPFLRFVGGVNSMLQNYGKGSSFLGIWHVTRRTILHGALAFAMAPYMFFPDEGETCKISDYYKCMWLCPVFAVLILCFAYSNFVFLSTSFAIIFSVAPLAAYLSGLAPIKKNLTTTHQEALNVWANLSNPTLIDIVYAYRLNFLDLDSLMEKMIDILPNTAPSINNAAQLITAYNALKRISQKLCSDVEKILSKIEYKIEDFGDTAQAYPSLDDKYYYSVSNYGFEFFASHNRLNIFLMISKRALSPKVWDRALRLFRAVGQRTALLSAHGNESDYFGDLPFLPRYHDTLLYETDKAVRAAFSKSKKHIRLAYLSEHNRPLPNSLIFLNLANALLNGEIVRDFLSDPDIHAFSVLLKEPSPSRAVVL